MSGAYLVDVVIVSHNTRDVLGACLASLVMESHPIAHQHVDLHVTIVDNGSTDGTTAMLARGYPGYRIIENTGNRGFAAAVNQGIAGGHAPLVLILNSDARLTIAGIATLCALMETDQRMALLGCRVAAPNQQPEASCGSFPGAMRGYQDRLRLLGQRTYCSPATGGLPRQVDWVSGVCCLARRSALQAISAGGRSGPFDEGFYMYFEDVDLCWRLKQAGWRVCYSDRVTVTHLGSASWADHVALKRRARDASQIRYFLKRGQWLAATAARARRAARLYWTSYYADPREVDQT